MNKIHKKEDAATTGFFQLVHDDTGKVFTGTSSNMQAAIIELKDQLEKCEAVNKRLRRLYLADPKFSAKYEPTRTITQAKKLEKEFRATKLPFLLIN